MKIQQNIFRLVVIGFIRVMLVLAMIISIQMERNLILIISILGLVMTLVPWISRTFLKSKIPAEFEIIVLFFLYGVIIFGTVRGFYAGHWWWDALLNLGGAMILGLVGLTILYVLEKEELIEANAPIIALFTFCFAFSLAGLWEIFEFTLDTFFGFGLQSSSLIDTMKDLIFGAIGSLLISIFGFFHIKSGKENFASIVLSRFMKKNLKLFKSKKYLEHSSNIIKKLIKKGEGENLEFKSTLRKNLHTNEFDKNMIHSVLKTIVAYLNSNGGTLLIGVSDSGKILGLENDGFLSHDKLKLYLTGILKSHIGRKFLTFITYEIYPIEDKHIIKINCRPCSKMSFLKWNEKEEFYVRHASSTIRLEGSDLIEYVSERFN